MKNKIFILGSFNVDIVSYLDDFPLPGQTIEATNSEIICGGKGANQAYAASQNGVEVNFLTKIGKDGFAHFAKEQLGLRIKQNNYILETEKAATGVANIFVRGADKENQIVINLGANKCITEKEVQYYKSLIEESDILMVQLENNFDAIACALKLAHDANVTTLLNPAPISPQISRLLPLVDIIIPNETELQGLGKMPVSSLDETKKAVLAFSKSSGIQTIVVTRGAKGALCFQNNIFTLIPSIENVNVVDTTGAGDAFNGALAAKLANGLNLEEAARYANFYASLAVAGKGASNMPEGVGLLI
ncbi:ribokinase [Parashewanella spongiae]|nr:ribokinase [Parashewanella spongiae]MCL1079197.1 ribokinase [Parashewanella spongiae]